MLKYKKYQTRFMNDISRFKLLMCGRRFGKTQIMKGEAYKRLIIPNTAGVYVAPTNMQAKQVFWNTFIEDIPREWIKRVSKTDPYTVELLNNSSLKIYGADAHDRLRGQGYDFALIDEVQDVKEEAFSESIFPALSDRQGVCIAAGTPKGRNNFAYDLFTNELFSVYHNTTIQGGWVAESEIELARSMLSPMAFRQEYEASFETSGSLAYYNFNNELNLTNQIFEPNRETFLCWDFNVNPMSCIIVQKDNNSDKVFAVKEFILNYSNTHNTCENVKSWLIQNKFNGKLWVTGDYAGNSLKSSATRSDYKIIESYFKEFAGFIRTVIKPTTSIKDRVEALNALFLNDLGHKRLFVNKYLCPKLVNDFNMVEWQDETWQLKAVNKELTHASDAISYFAFNFYPVHTTIWKFN